MFEYILENIYVILTIVFFMSTLYFAIKSYNTKVMAGDREKFLQAEQERIGYYKFNNGLILGFLKAKVMGAKDVTEFDKLLLELESACNELGVALDRIINKVEITKKRNSIV